MSDDLTYDFCDTCDKSWPEDRFNRACRNPQTCFRCRSKGVGVGFQGGKSYWHDDTESRRAQRAMAEGRAAGFDPVPVRTASVSASAASIKSAGAISKAHPIKTKA